MNKPKAGTMAVIAVATGVATYGVLSLLAPHRQQDVRHDGLIAADKVFTGDAQAASTEVAAASSGTTLNDESPAPGTATAADDPAPPIEAPSPAPTPAEPAPETVATAETARTTAALEPATTPSKPAPFASAPPPAKPAPRPVAKAAASAAKREPTGRAVARAATTAAAPPPTAWWQSGAPTTGLQITYVGSASFKRAIVVLANAPFAETSTADRSIAILDADGRPLSGLWESSTLNRSMLVFPVPSAGRYEVIIGGGLSDAQNRSLGKTLRGPIEVN